MRTYYIFNINKEMSILTKDSPYLLFKSFESIYRYGKDDFDIAFMLYQELTCSFNKNVINNRILSKYKDNQFYIGTSNNHNYYNKYRDEFCKIRLKNNYLICQCNSGRLDLINSLIGLNLFACDFQNKDYFWIDEIYC